MDEPIIIDTQLHPDEEYEPLHRSIAEVLTKKVCAEIIRHECKMHGNCHDCMFYDNDENYPICVLTMRTPEDWALEHISQLNEEG